MPPLDNFVSNFQTVNLSSDDYIYYTKDYKTLVRSQKNFDNAPFNRYCSLKLADNVFSVAELRFQFMKDFDIKYLIVKHGAHLPLILEPLVVYSFFDPISSECFYIIDYD